MLEISALSVIAILVLWVPLVSLAVVRVTIQKTWPVWLRFGLAVSIAVIGYAVPLWDVTVNTIAFRRACVSAGAHIYQTVEVDGLLTNMLGSDYVGNGRYRFIERRDGKFVTRFEYSAGGKPTVTSLENPTAQYELLSDTWTYYPEHGIERIRKSVSNRGTGQLIAEWLAFMPRHGWIDQILLVSLFGGDLPACTGRADGNMDFDFFMRAARPAMLTWESKE